MLPPFAPQIYKCNDRVKPHSTEKIKQSGEKEKNKRNNDEHTKKPYTIKLNYARQTKRRKKMKWNEMK